MKTIELTNSDKVVFVDDNIFEELSVFKWYLHSNGYAHTSMNGKRIYMHRYINNTPKGMQTDHINGNKLDNQSINLRTCTISQNQINVKRTPEGQYRGVTLDKRRGKYQAKIKIGGKTTHIGMFKTKEEAALSYNDYAYIYHGEFAVLNKVKGE